MPLERNLYIILLVLVCLVFVIFLHQTKSKHNRYIKSANNVLKKIRTFTGEYKEAKIFTYLRKISPYVFEELLLTVFEEHGYNIKRNKRYSHDGGIDGKIYNNGSQVLVQAKRYKGHINPKHVTDFQNCIHNSKAIKGFFVHTGKTSKKNLDIYRNSNITILSGQRLIDFIFLKKYPLERQ